jgi:hypothetical protein
MTEAERTNLKKTIETSITNVIKGQVTAAIVLATDTNAF